MTFRSQLALAAGTALALTAIGASRAEAFTFTTNYTIDGSLTGDDVWRGDLWLKSVAYGGETFNQFSLVDWADIVHNDQWTGGNTGAASADTGKFSTTGVIVEDPDDADIVTNLGNLNLSNIVDGEDKGSYTLDLMFDRAARDVLVWERGMNSDLTLQALGKNGSLLGNYFTITRDLWQDAGFRLGTTEIGNNIQNVGSWGISAADFGLGSSLIYGVRVIADGSIDNGPDFKLVGTAAVPEPSLIFGFGALALMGLASRRRGNEA